MNTCLGSGRVRIASRKVAGQYEQKATGAGNQEAPPPPWKRKCKGKGKGERPQGPLGQQPPAPAPTVSDRQHQVVPPRSPPGAGVGLPPAPEAPPSEDMVQALKRLQSVMTPEDFSKYEKKAKGGTGEAP